MNCANSRSEPLRFTSAGMPNFAVKAWAIVWATLRSTDVYQTTLPSRRAASTSCGSTSPLALAPAPALAVVSAERAGGGAGAFPPAGAAGEAPAPAGGDPPAHAPGSQAANVNRARYRMSVPPERLLVWSSSHAPRAVAGARTIPATGRAVKNPWRQVAAAGRGRRHFWTVPEKGTYSTGAGIEACKA